MSVERDFFLSAFEKRFGGGSNASAESAGLRALRKLALDRFAAKGFPTLRQEEWRHTSLAPLTKATLRAERADSSRSNLAGSHVELGPVEDGVTRLAFVDGAFRPEFSSKNPGPAKGVYVAPLSRARHEQPALIEKHLAAGASDSPFVALNLAFAEEGAVIILDDGVDAGPAIDLVWVETAASAGTFHHPRVVIAGGAKSRATVVERFYATESAGAYFTNAQTTVVLAEGATLEHGKIQEEGLGAFHLAGTRVEQAGDSRYISHLVQLGGALARNEIHVGLRGSHATCTLNGLYATRGKQHHDSRSVVDHASPSCRSEELYKGVISGEARAVFNGTIHVREQAQKTDADQTSRNLLLSPNAMVMAQPQLRILADDVRCTHGATVSQLDDLQLFYLRSRGIGPSEARRLVTYAFMGELVSRLPAGSNWRRGVEARLGMWLDEEGRG